MSEAMLSELRRGRTRSCNTATCVGVSNCMRTHLREPTTFAGGFDFEINKHQCFFNELLKLSTAPSRLVMQQGMRHAFCECDAATALSASLNIKALISGLRQTIGAATTGIRMAPHVRFVAWHFGIDMTNVTSASQVSGSQASGSQAGHHHSH